MTIGVKYVCPVYDSSGYGEASRNYILALHKARVPVTVQPHCFDRDPPLVGTDEERRTINSLINKDIEYDTVIVHLTPDMVPEHAAENPGKKIISYMAWETDRLHPMWAHSLKPADEVWVPSRWNKEALITSGVTCPIFVIHHGIDPEHFSGAKKSDFQLPGNTDDGTFTFYSIMQWNARKNPEGLIRAYYNAFSSSDNVRLLLKAYLGINVPGQTQTIKNMIMSIKQDMGTLSFPKINLITDQLTSTQVKALHMFGDCYVCLPHGEGFGLTSFEAGLAGKPVISTGAGGSTEYMTSENSFMIRASESYVSGMSSFNPWYLGNQKWFDPDLIEASEAMRFVFNNQKASNNKAKKLKDNIVNNFSWDEVSKKMIERL